MKMKRVDIYIVGRHNEHIAAYLSAKTGMPYDSNGLNVLVIENAIFGKIPLKVFQGRISKMLEIRKSEGEEKGDIVFPKGVTKESLYDA
jgi:hypothetical protein